MKSKVITAPHYRSGELTERQEDLLEKSRLVKSTVTTAGKPCR